jgi:uncharacterized membrane protein YphA (DoxX/SURF4 family)
VVDALTPGDSSHEAAAVAASDRVLGESRSRWMLRLAGRLAGRALGVVFLTAGVLKALAPMAFSQEIAQYGIITNPIATGLVAYAIVIVECGLGAALLVNLRPRISLSIGALLLLMFLGAIGWAWATGSTAECGCFGPWKRTPPQAFAEDLAILVIVPWAWWGRRFTQAPTNALKLALVGLGVASGIMIPAVASMTGAAEPGAKGVVGSDVFKTLEVSDLSVNLATGEHLVLLMSTTCPHCQAAVPDVNALAGDQRLPKVVAVAMNDRVERGLFREDYSAQYPIGEISQQAVYALLKKDLPRLFLVRDGRIVAVWDGKIPTADEVLTAGGSSQ